MSGRWGGDDEEGRLRARRANNRAEQEAILREALLNTGAKPIEPPLPTPVQVGEAKGNIARDIAAAKVLAEPMTVVTGYLPQLPYSRDFKLRYDCFAGAMLEMLEEVGKLR